MKPKHFEGDMLSEKNFWRKPLFAVA